MEKKERKGVWVRSGGCVVAARVSGDCVVAARGCGGVRVADCEGWGL